MMQLLIFLLWWTPLSRTDEAKKVDGPVANSEVACQELKVNDTKVVNVPWDRSPTLLETHYTLRRTDEKRYVVDLNMSFANDTSYDGDLGGFTADDPRAADYVNTTYRRKVQECFNYYRGKIKDPSGNIIDFNLPAQENSKEFRDSNAARVNILVQSSSATWRSDSANYASDIDCPTIMHETMHVLGLVDEYKEGEETLLDANKAKAHGFDETEGKAYDCRKLGGPFSIMVDQSAALAEGKNYDGMVCICDDSHKQLCETGAIMHGDSCPEGTTSDSPFQGFYANNQMDQIKQLLDQQNWIWMIKKEWEPTTPVLNGTQSNAILKPNCESTNGQYYKCAIDAYNTTESHGGDGCQAPSSCRKARGVRGHGH